MINRTLDGRYTIIEPVGGGGMAEVYRAHDQLLDRSVAVKILRLQFTNDDDFVTRFRREAQAAAKLSNPNIVNIYDVGHDGDVYYIVMEYIQGETLKDKVDREGPLPIDVSVRIALEIAEALEHAHQNNLVHCDIKPHNILMTRNGRVKVTDFGIARAVTSTTMTQTGTIMGSVHYFSPEQAKGAAVDAKSDIYSLGVVLYEMLTGTVPFTGDSPISIALKHIQEPPRPPRELNPSIPPLLEATILKAMAKNPAERFANISDMITDLRLSVKYLRDDETRRMSRDDFATQVLPRVNAAEHLSQPVSQDALARQKAERRKKRLKVLALFGLLVVGFAIGAFMAFGKFWSSAEVTVPNVVGKQVDVAKSELEAKNLRVSISETYSEDAPAGIVISQYPEAGTIVKEQRMITITVSKGSEITSMPDLRGLSRRDAEQKLKSLGLKLGRVDEQYVANASPDTVLGQNPAPGSQINKGTAVDIVINKSNGQHKVTLPDFRGSTLKSITTQLESLKLQVGSVSYTNSDKYADGTICAQNPGAGTEIAEGAAVDFTIARAGGSHRSSVQFTVPDGSASQSISIVVNDANGRRTVYEGSGRPGERISKSFDVSGQGSVQCFANGTLVQEQSL